MVLALLGVPSAQHRGAVRREVFVELARIQLGHSAKRLVGELVVRQHRLVRARVEQPLGLRRGDDDVERKSKRDRWVG